MIRKLDQKDVESIYQIVNQAAKVYQGRIPDDCYREPYMPKEEIFHEMNNMDFFGSQIKDKLLGVMGFQPVKDMTLIRHAYVLPEYQRMRIGKGLLEHLKHLTKTRYLLVGTWADATWAIYFYQKQGFKLFPNKDELLNAYWNISPRQVETSVVLGLEIKRFSK